MGEWIKLHNEEINDPYCSGDKTEKNEMGGTWGRGEAYTGF